MDILFGKFISPHLININERITVNDIEITNKEMCDIIDELSMYVDEYNETNDIPVKWFEIITSVALIYFYRKKCDFVVLETGLGGTWDCTNITESSLAIITSVGKDHMHILGNTLEEIAENKAGIIKANSDVIYLENDIDDKKILNVIKKKCNVMNANIHIVNKKDCKNLKKGNDYKNSNNMNNMQFFDYKEFKNVPIILKGNVQIYNSAICLEATEILREKGYTIDENLVKKALSEVKHRARFEKINNNPEIIFDGAHNEPAIDNLISTINEYYRENEKIFILSILTTKDYISMTRKLVNHFGDATFYFTDGLDNGRFVKKEELLNVALVTLNEGIENSKDNNNKENNNSVDNKSSETNEVNKISKVNKYITCSFEQAINEAMEKYKDTEKKVFIIGSFYMYKSANECINNRK